MYSKNDKLTYKKNVVMAYIVNLLCGFSISAGVFFVLIIYFVKNPEKVEKWIALFSKLFKNFWKVAEHTYVKMDVQYTVNAYMADLRKLVPSLLITHVQISWIDENMTQE